MLVRRPDRNPRQPAREPYYGPLMTHDFITGNLPYIGQVSPVTSTIMREWHGRYLSGVEGYSGQDPMGNVDIDPAYQSHDLYDLEEQDDVYGSGVFDAPGREATANARTGIFASHYSIPGYVGREQPFTVSEVTDITDDANVVMVPAGGMSFAEVRGQMQYPPALGPSRRPPPLELTPPASDSRMDVYKELQIGKPQPPLNPSAPHLPAPTYHPARQPVHWTRDVPWYPLQRQIPAAPVQRTLGRRYIVQPIDARQALGATNEMSDDTKLIIGAAVAGVLAGVAVELLTR
jgi:hypothetical protein